MERIEAKRIHGNTYYYYSKWERVNGRCRRVWQKYLGKPHDIAAAVSGEARVPAYAEVFEWGLSTALWKECTQALVREHIDRVLPKRDQGLSIGTYLAIAALNRAIDPKSKRCVWDWFSNSSLRRVLPMASKAALSSQRFWDHMDKIKRPAAMQIWKNLVAGIVQREEIDLSQVSYDGTNFYTFIDTFNARCSIAKRGKNKQGRGNLRQISYALFCSRDGGIPLFFDVYDGNINDAQEFPRMLKKFSTFLKYISEKSAETPKVTLIFDKGNNSLDNFALVDKHKLHYVGSVKLDEHKDIAALPNDDSRFTPCEDPRLEGTRALRITKKAYGKQRVLIVTHHQRLFNAQWSTIQNDMTNAMQKLETLKQKLQDRASGIIKGGPTPTVASIEKQCKKILSRQYMQSVISYAVTKLDSKVPQLSYMPDTDALQKICNTSLGKNILITDRSDWTNEEIITAYRSQHVIENIFKEAKDRNYGTWWPVHHWTDSKLYVHGLYCSIALLLRALIKRRIAQSNLKLSTHRLLTELSAIREVVNVYPAKRNKTPPQQTVLTKTSELQNDILKALSIEYAQNQNLG